MGLMADMVEAYRWCFADMSLVCSAVVRIVLQVFKLVYISFSVM